MAKVGFWLRGSKGKLAGTSIYRGKGGTQIREIVTPSNPRSGKQMTQRSLFIDAVKFYHRGQQNFFPFAFENKKPEWSEFNAFMNANAKRGVNITKAQNESISYPALGNWIMSQGSLTSLNIRYNTSAVAGLVPGFQITRLGVSAIETVADLSRAIVESYGGINYGDFLTLCFVITREDFDYPDYDPVSAQPVEWHISQIKLSLDDVRLLSEVLGFSGVTIAASADGALTFQASEFSTLACGFSATISRVTPAGTFVSNSELIGNPVAVAAIAAARNEESVAQVLTSWGAADDAVLQGAIATKPAGTTVSVSAYGNYYEESTGAISQVTPLSLEEGDPLKIYVKADVPEGNVNYLNRQIFNVQNGDVPRTQQKFTWTKVDGTDDIYSAEVVDEVSESTPTNWSIWSLSPTLGVNIAFAIDI